jgi:hypothetical protein
MPPALHQINPKWREGLVGLWMVVPLSWWPGYSGTNICLCKIAKFDPTKSLLFLIEVDNKPGNFYAM